MSENNQHPEPNSAQSGNAKSGLPALLVSFKENGPFVYALLAASIYVFGFLVLNAHLAKHGIVDYDFVDTRYIFSGASFVFFLICFYLFAGRTVLHTPRWLEEDMRHYKKLGFKSGWTHVVFVNSLVNMGFQCCLSAALFSSTAFGDIETAFFYALLAVAFFILYTLDVTNLDIRFPRTHLVVLLAVRFGASIAFFANTEYGMLLAVFLMYVTLVIFINLAIDSLTRHGATRDHVSYSAVYSVLILFSTAIAFGALLFGNVSTKIGGARSQSVAATLAKNATEVLPPELISSPAYTVVGKLIHQTDRFAYVEVSDKTIRLRSSDIVAMVVTPEKQRSFWTELLQRQSPVSTKPQPIIPSDVAR